MEDDEYRKLPPEEKCVHKLWKARLCGYEEVTKLFQQIDDDKSPEFSKYLGLIKNFVNDSNAAAQEKGLEATLAFVENYAHAGKTVGEVVSCIVKKCIAASKTRTRELSLQIILMYVEIEKQDVVMEELIKGMDLKNPKIVCGCISACTTSLREFGSKVIAVKPLVKKISTLFADRDKGVRDEGRALVIEIYKWIGPAIKAQLGSLQPVQLTELEIEFSKIDGQKAIPTRFIRSEQAKKAVMAIQNTEIADENEDDECDGPPVVDAYDLADPVDILSKLPKDFYEKLESKKWQERKEVLENLETLLKTPKLENGDYGDLVRALRKVIQKDSNIICVTFAGKCTFLLASGLKKRFQTYSSACISPILEKFKEKKQTVVTVMRDAIDAIYLTTSLDSILEDVLEALGNKNPSVKSETALFLARAFTKTQPALINKKLLKAICAGLLKIISESDPTVRDSTSEALGTLMKLLGEKAVMPFLVEIEKDNIKMTRIKEFCEKAVIIVKTTTAKKERPATAPIAKVVSEQVSRAAAAPPKTTKRSASASNKKQATISSGTATIVKGKAKAKVVSQLERELSDEEVQEKVEVIFQPSIINSLVDGNWKIRLEGVQNVLIAIQELDASSIPTQAVVKLINRKPGLKDTNFQVLNVRLDVVKYLAENCTFTVTTADTCLNDISEKLGDPKSGLKAADTLTAVAEAVTLNHVSLQVVDFALGQKSPKVMQEAFVWLSSAIKEFGFLNLNAKVLIESSKKALASTNPAVRTSAIKFLGVLYMYMGPTLHMFFDNEKPVLRDQIIVEFNKYENIKPPIPTRGIVKSDSASSFNEDVDESAETPAVNVQDLLPRIDISNQITETLITELSDKNWKVRNEALTRINSILSESKLIKPNLADLPQALAPRLVDSNTKIAQTAIVICENLANAMGPPCKQHIRAFFPGLLQGLGDSKAWIRTAAITTINAFGDQCGYKEFFDGEMIFDGLKLGSPTLRTELWIWLADKLPKLKSVPKEELMICIPFLYTNLEDRNADVRKNAQEAVLGFMIHLGYECMLKQTEKLKPGSKNVIMGILEKVRPNLPVKPLPPKKSNSLDNKEDKVVRGTKPVATSKNAVKPKAQTTNKPSNRKKDEDVDTSPLLAVNNLKQQRSIDESKMKVLKWNFTTPREEFVDLLKEQMTTANVNKSLIQNMFHSDFRYHIKAIESLMEDLPKNEDALADNLDLILKWLTLRFFDTNPSVLLKGLEYLHSVFNMLTEKEYKMPDTEAAAFIPYLITKIGDPKDSVRNGVRSLFKQLWTVYSINKIFSYLMDGLKSKNARQRAECLDVMGLIIDTFGLSVCLPNPNVCLKEIAKQISDRDNGVRNAALNCLVLVYYIENEKVYKMIGNISAKDMSLLEERIKRASKRPPNITKLEPVTVPLIAGQPINVQETIVTSSDNVVRTDEDSDTDDLPEVVLPRQVIQEHEPEAEGPFQLDANFINALDEMCVKPVASNLERFDLDFLKEEIKIPTAEEVKSRVIDLTPPKPILPKQMFHRSPLGSRVSSSKSPDMVVEKTINSIASSDFNVAVQGCEQMMLLTTQREAISDYENELMFAISSQLSNLRNKDPRIEPKVSTVYRNIFTLIDYFYANKNFGRKLSADAIKSIIKQLLWELGEGKFAMMANGDSYIKVANIQCVKIIEKSDPTNVLCGVLSLFHEFIQTNPSSRLVDLVMKTLWRIIRLMPPWANDINYDKVLLQVHNFLKDYPSSWWKDKNDTPLRTIKTIVHTLTKMKGDSIMTHLCKIPNLKESEIEVYILRVLRTLKLDEVKQVPLKSDSRKSLSRIIHTHLTDIFQKIGNKEETDEGLNLLYDFLQEHPEADIDPFIRRSSPFFQDYIENNLKEIENARKLASIKASESKITTTATLGSAPSVVNSSVSPTNSNDANTRNPKYWMERLKMWQQLWNDKLIAE